MPIQRSKRSNGRFKMRPRDDTTASANSIRAARRERIPEEVALSNGIEVCPFGFADKRLRHGYFCP